MKRKASLSVFIMVIIPNFLMAHGGIGSGIIAGFTHTTLGIDHFLAMLCIGILSATIGKKTIWLILFTFVTSMLFGGLLGIGQDEINLVETAIAISVILLGVLVARGMELSSMALMLLAVIIALFHGYAHGVETPDIAHASFYFSGFLLGTTIVLIIGIAIGKYAMKDASKIKKLRFLGAFIAGMAAIQC